MAAASRLVENRATLEDVAAAMRDGHRQTAGQTANILRSLRATADRAGAVVQATYRLRGENVTVAILAGGFRADEAAAGLLRAGVSGEEVTRGFRTAAVDAVSASRVLRAAGVEATTLTVGLRASATPVGEVAPILIGEYGMDGQEAARSVIVGGYDPPAAALALIANGVVGTQVVSGFLSARVTPAATAAALEIAGASQDAVAEGFYLARVRANEAVEAAVAAYMDLSAMDQFQGLTAAGYPASEVSELVTALMSLTPLDQVAMAQAAGTAWRVTADLLRQAGMAEGEICQTLVSGGYDFDAPVIDEYEIANYRNGFGAGSISDLGIVDPDKVAGESVSGDGEVRIDGQGLDAPCLEVRIVHDGGTTLGEITDDGSTLTVEFEGFGSGTLEVETVAGVAQAAVLALSHAKLAATEVFAATPAVTLGGTTGVLTAIPYSGSFSLENEDSGALDISIVGTSSGVLPVLVTMTSNQLRADFVFPLNVSIAGVWRATYPCWKCGTLEVPKQRCSALDVSCFSGVLGSAINNAATCLNVNNWSSSTGDFPPHAFVTSVLDPTLTVGARVQVTGQTGANPTLTAIAGPAGLSGVVVPPPQPPPVGGLTMPPVPQSTLQSRFASDLDEQITDALAPSFSQGFLDQLANPLGSLPGRTLRAVYATADGEVLAEYVH
jgi:hypothetical protein